MKKIIVCFLIALLTIPTFTLATFAGQKRTKAKAEPNSQQKEKQEIEETQTEIASLLQRLAMDEEDISRGMNQVKSDLRLRELRWKTFERSAAVVDEPFTFHPVKIELFGTYERLTDMLLSLAALNYLVIVDGLEIKRAKQPAPLVSVEAEFTLLIYNLDEKGRKQLQNPVGENNIAQLESAKNSLALLNSRFEERVLCWSALRRLAKRFPKSVETILTNISLDSRILKISGISRSAEQVKLLVNEMNAAQIFTEINLEQNGPNFSIQTILDVSKAYQQWLEGLDTSDQEVLARDPFTTIYTLEQLTQGSNANTNYPTIEKRIEEYLQLVNQPNVKRPDRSSPYLVSELALAGLYFTPTIQGGIFKTPNQKEFFVPVGGRCYNGRFVAIQQTRALFEETIVDSNGKSQISQITKIIDSPSCSVVSLPPNVKETERSIELEKVAKEKLPNWPLTLKFNNVEFRSLLLLLHELSDYQFGFVIDQSVPPLCVSLSRERVPFNEFVSSILHSVNLTYVLENGVFHIMPFDQTAEANSPVLAIGLETQPAPGKFGSKDFKAESLTLSITDIELGDVLSFFTSKYNVKFAYTATVKQIKVTAVIKDLPWTQALTAILRSARLGAVIEGDRILILNRADLIQAQNAGRVKVEQ